jgi:putative transposase
MNNRLDQQYIVPDKISLEEGEVIIIRFIRSDRSLNIFGEIFLVKEELVYTYVEAIIVISSQKLIVKRDGIIEHIFEYLLPSNE